MARKAAPTPRTTTPPSIFRPGRLGLLMLAGVLGALAFPLAFPIGPRQELLASGVLEPLAFVCLVPALLAMRGLRPAKAFVVGFFAGMVFFSGAFWWVNVAMTTFGGMPNFLSIPALLMLVAWCAFHWGLAFGVVRFLVERNGWPIGWTLGPVWMATELLRNYLFSGFPWANLGYSQARNLWFSQVASLAGVYGIALVIAVVNGALYEVVRWRVWKERGFPRALVATAAVLLVGGHVYGALRVARWDDKLASAERVKVAVVQGNIDQKLKNMQGDRPQAVLAQYNAPTSRADDAGADLIVWPEAAFPRAFPRGSRSLLHTGLERPRYQAHLLLGVDVFDPRDWKHGNENAAYLVAPDLRVLAQYTKHHLVPFGEYVLFDLDKILPIDNLVPGTFIPGKSLEPMTMPVASLAAAGKERTLKVGVEICFDAIFPEISRTYGQQDVDLLVNLTNDAWYGFSSAPFQFLRMVQMRAVEIGRPVARAANTGISAFVDPVGRILQPTEIGLARTDDLRIDTSQLAAPVWRVESLPLVSGRTLYVVIGDVLAYAAALFSVFGVGYGVWRRARKEKHPRNSRGT